MLVIDTHRGKWYAAFHAPENKSECWHFGVRGWARSMQNQKDMDGYFNSKEEVIKALLLNAFPEKDIKIGSYSLYFYQDGSKIQLNLLNTIVTYEQVIEIINRMKR